MSEIVSERVKICVNGNVKMEFLFCSVLQPFGSTEAYINYKLFALLAQAYC